MKGLYIIMAYGKSIELFLVNGTADSLVTAELSNWNGKAIKIPRIEVTACKREDITAPGVYFLFCKEDDGSDSVYIGEAENVKERLVRHIQDFKQDKETYEWNTAVIFVGRDLNKALIRYLENRLFDIAKECNRVKLLTKNTYRNTVLKESQIAVMEEFIENIKVLLNTLGYKTLEPYVSGSTSDSSIMDNNLYLNTKTASAVGRVTTEGFVVLKGAKVNEKTSPKSLSPGLIKLREKAFADEKVKDFETVEDMLFSSSSAAADFVLGYSVSGPMFWKNKEGVVLKDLENE